ncbi:MAG: hypothetical protein ABSF25_25425 [Bryobacteraceae bacterium]|jgi:hypothetical protein
MKSSVQEAIDGLYNAFRDVPKPMTVDGCPCCIDKKGISILLSKPLRDLSPEDLTHYAASVFLTVGAVEDFLYFLPRIMEILVSENDWWPDPEVVARSIHTAGFHSWPVSRRHALSRLFDEVISGLLATEGSGFELDSWICALGRLHIDLASYLARIALNRARLVELYEVNSRQLTDGRLSNSFWDDAPEEEKQVVNWFRSEESRKAIESQYGL